MHDAQPDDARTLGQKLIAHRTRVWTRCRVCNRPVYGYETKRFCGNTHQRQDYRHRLTLIGRFEPGVVPSVDDVHGDPTSWLIDGPDDPHEAASKP